MSDYVAPPDVAYETITRRAAFVVDVADIKNLVCWKPDGRMPDLPIIAIVDSRRKILRGEIAFSGFPEGSRWKLSPYRKCGSKNLSKREREELVEISPELGEVLKWLVVSLAEKKPGSRLFFAKNGSGGRRFRTTSSTKTVETYPYYGKRPFRRGMKLRVALADEALASFFIREEVRGTWWMGQIRWLTNQLSRLLSGYKTTRGKGFSQALEILYDRPDFRRPEILRQALFRVLGKELFLEFLEQEKVLLGSEAEWVRQVPETDLGGRRICLRTRKARSRGKCRIFEVFDGNDISRPSFLEFVSPEVQNRKEGTNDANSGKEGYDQGLVFAGEKRRGREEISVAV